MNDSDRLQLEYQRAEIYFIGALTVFLLILEIIKMASGTASSIANLVAYIGCSLLLISGGLALMCAEGLRKEILAD